MRGWAAASSWHYTQIRIVVPSTYLLTYLLTQIRIVVPSTMLSALVLAALLSSMKHWLVPRLVEAE